MFHLFYNTLYYRVKFIVSSCRCRCLRQNRVLERRVGQIGLTVATESALRYHIGGADIYHAVSTCYYYTVLVCLYYAIYIYNNGQLKASCSFQVNQRESRSFMCLLYNILLVYWPLYNLCYHVFHSSSGIGSRDTPKTVQRLCTYNENMTFWSIIYSDFLCIITPF